MNSFDESKLLEILNSLVEYEMLIGAINNHAIPRTYDWIILTVAIFTFITSTIVAIFSYKLNQKQSQILEQQNKISLFKERYELFKDLEQIEYNSTSVKEDLYPRLKTLSTHYDKVVYIFRLMYFDVLDFDLIEPKSEEEQNENIRKIQKQTMNFIVKLQKIELLFKLNNEELENFTKCNKFLSTIYYDFLMQGIRPSKITNLKDYPRVDIALELLPNLQLVTAILKKQVDINIISG